MRWQVDSTGRWYTDEEIICEICKKKMEKEKDKIIEIKKDKSFRYLCYPDCFNPSKEFSEELSENLSEKEEFKTYSFLIINNTRLLEYLGDVFRYEVMPNGKILTHTSLREGFCSCEDDVVVFECDDESQFCQRCYRLIEHPIRGTEDDIS